jgi:hypothetical protein
MFFSCFFLEAFLAGGVLPNGGHPEAPVDHTIGLTRLCPLVTFTNFIRTARFDLGWCRLPMGLSSGPWHHSCWICDVGVIHSLAMEGSEIPLDAL